MASYYIQNRTVYNYELSDGDEMLVYPGGVANLTTVSGGVLYVVSGGQANYTAVEAGGSLLVLLAGSANSTMVNSGALMWVASDGVISKASVEEDGYLYVGVGATALGVIENGGYVDLEEGAHATFSSNTISGMTLSGSATVHDGTIVEKVSIAGGKVFVFSGGSVSSATLDADGSLCISSGAIADFSIVKSGGSLCVSSGGVANNTVLTPYEYTVAGANMCVSSGGTANNTVVNYDGVLNVSSGGLASGIVINEHGSVCVVDNGSASDVTVNFGGTVYALRDGVADTVEINSSGAVYVHSGVIRNASINADGVLHISGGVADSTTVNSGGSADVFSGGTANNTVINSGGILSVSSGARIQNTTLLDAGEADVYAGAFASGITLANGYGSVRISGTAEDVRNVVTSGRSSGGDVIVEKDGYVSRLLVAGQGDVYVLKDGRVEDVQVLSGGRLNLGNDGEELLPESEEATESEEVEFGSATNVQIASGGQAVAESSGFIDQVTVSQGGLLTVKTAGTVTDADISNGGKLLVSSGGLGSSVAVNSRGTVEIYGTVKDAVVNAGGRVEVFSGGTATDVVENGGYVNVQGNASVTFASNNLNDLIVSKTSASIHSGTTATDAMVNSNGLLVVFDGGIIKNAAVYANGQLNINSNGVFSGYLQLSSGAAVYAAAGAIVDFTVVEQEDPTRALISNLAKIDGYENITYTLTINAYQASGTGHETYILAENAAAFDETITVKTTNNTELGTISVGEVKDFCGARYSLVKDDGVLSLDILREIPKAARGDFGGTIGVSDILFQNLDSSTGNALGAWMDADSSKWVGDLGQAPLEDWTVYGAYDFTGDGICDIMFRSKQESNGYAVGYYDMGDGGTFKTMGWGVTEEWELADVGDFNGNGVSDILWKNTSNGYLGLWMDGTNQWIDIPYSGLTAGQTVVGTGDANGDGIDDIIINFNGTLGSWDISAIVAGSGTAPVRTDFAGGIGYDWDTVGCADFDGNGITDVVLWNDNGYIGTYMNCDGNDFCCIYSSASKEEWAIPGFGDYDGDGSEDVLVRNQETGALGYWDGNDNFSWHAIGFGVDSTWAVIA